jgi:UPF0755 protein
MAIRSRSYGGGTSPAGLAVLAVVAVLLLGACGFGFYTVQTDLNQPVASGNAPCRPFTVNPGDSINTIADNLESAHLIRNALIFKLYLKLNNKTLNAEPGKYCISPSMDLGTITSTLNTPPNVAYVKFTVPEGDRLSQYAADILSTAVLHDPGNKDDGLKGQQALPNFKASDFNTITIKTGSFPGSAQYWFVQPWATGSGHALTKLEGYLFPNTYYVDPKSDAVAIIKTMLNGLGEALCPGPSSTPDQYILDQQQCEAHQAIITPPAIPPQYQANVGKPIGVFDALRAKKISLQQAIILASLAQREARTAPHFFLVDSTYYNRWQDTGVDPFGYLSADPAEQYWLGAKGSNPWPNLPDTPKNLASNPYNLYLVPGLPPSAISGPGLNALYGAIDIISTNYRFFFYGCDHENHYYPDPSSFDAGQQQIGVPGVNC